MPDASDASTSGVTAASGARHAVGSEDARSDGQRPYWVHDAIAGFGGGAVGILAPNALDLLKVREQVASTQGALPGPSSKATKPKVGTVLPKSEGIIRGLRTLYRKEGWRVFFAGSLGPVSSYALIDAVFFSIWGQVMELRHQDRDDPSSLGSSFLAASAAGASCAILQTPIEVVKVRAQIEREGAGRARMGTIQITRKMMRKEGIRGFFKGFSPTLVRDTLANGIFFPAYHVCRRLVRGEHPFMTRREAIERHAAGETSVFRVAPTEAASTIDAGELGRVFVAGGVAGALSMLATYPFDVIKTQAQQSVQAAAAGERPDLTMRGLTAHIWHEGRLAVAQHPHAATRSRLARTLIQASGFSRGLKLGIVTSALQSAVILTLFELGVSLLSGRHA